MSKAPQTKIDLLDPTTGELTLTGWGIDQADYYNINYEQAADSGYVPAKYRYRAWDFYMFYLGDKHVV